MNRLNVEDKRVGNIKNIMKVFEVVCFVLAFAFVSFILSAHLILGLLKIEIPEQLQAAFIALLIVLCAVWLLCCVFIPIVNWRKEQSKKKQLNDYGKDENYDYE